MKRLLVNRMDSLESYLYVNLPDPEPVKIKFKRLHPDAKIPSYESAGAAGCDIVSVEDVSLANLGMAMIATGFALELPPGYEAQIRPRSGLSIKGLMVANAPATLDSDFRGEVKVIVRWIRPATLLEYCTFEIKRGMRIAQLIIAPVVRAVFEEVETLNETKRGEKGFGSSGV